MASKTDHAALNVLQLDVRGMHCINCAGLVERKLKELAQVDQASVDYPTGRAVVWHSGQLEIADLRRAMGDEGYTLSIAQ